MHPDALTAEQINDLRRAAEVAWGDDVRHPNFIGHPQASAGQCFVTAQWLTHHLGGHVGTKAGHFFWVSPDKRHILDLCGDWFAYPPMDPMEDGKLQDEDDEPWAAEPYLKSWRPGPAMYKRSDHPLWKGLRIIEPQPEHPRARLFAQRADAALRNKTAKTADLLGADPYPGETPQKIEDMNQLNLHDEPGFDQTSDLSTKLYQFVFANNQIHVSPIHSHEELAGHAGLQPQHTGPMAIGYLTVNQGKATWEVETNIAVQGLAKALKDYTKNVGWRWQGMIGTDGTPIDEAFGPVTSMWYKAARLANEDDRLVMSQTPLPHGKQIRIEGNVAYVPRESGWVKEALREWADDFGYRLADYPGGTDMTDRMKTKEDLDVYNRGDTDFEPERDNPDLEPQGPFQCKTCGYTAPTFADFRLHTREHEPMEDQIENGHFPNLNDFDDPLPLRDLHPTPTAIPISASVQVLPLCSYEDARRVPEFDLYARLFGYDHDEQLQFYGAYKHGEMLGYGVVRMPSFGEEPEVMMIHASVHRQGVGSALMRTIQTHFPNFYTHSDSPQGERLMRRHGVTNVYHQRWRYAAGKEPKDMIEAPIPFVYDIRGNHEHKDGNIVIGYPGTTPHDIPGRFTPGGIVEGTYEPGGKVIVQTATTMPWSVHFMVRLWYALYPQMEVTSVEIEGRDGKTQKLAGETVGSYIRTLAISDQAANTAWKALREAGGKVYVVGGAIRDALQQRIPQDVDLMVAGLPTEEVDHILSQLPGSVNVTGKRFGVYRYKVGGQEVEVALPRQDKYETSRRGEGQITVDHNLPVEKDLERRDFTANSMAVDLDSGMLIDPHGGAGDLSQGILRTTHPDSFAEDPTRLVRALAAHGRFGLNPDERTRQEMITHAARLREESPDSLNKVLDKLFKSPNPAGALRLGQDTGILQHLFPAVAQHFDFDQQHPNHHLPLGDHLLSTLDGVTQQTDDPDLRMAAFLHDIGKPASQWFDDKGVAHYYEANGQGANHETVGARMAEDNLRDLNYPVARIRRITGIIDGHMYPAFSTHKGARKFLQRYEPYADDLLTLRRADMEGKGQSPDEVGRRTSADTMTDLVNQARSQQDPTSQSALSINGNDLLAMGVPAGPEVGQILRQLVDHVVEVPLDNDRERLLQIADGYVQALPNRGMPTSGQVDSIGSL